MPFHPPSYRWLADIFNTLIPFPSLIHFFPFSHHSLINPLIIYTYTYVKLSLCPYIYVCIYIYTFTSHTQIHAHKNKHYLIHIMMSFCKKRVHSLLGLHKTPILDPNSPSCKCVSTAGGLGLMSATTDSHRAPNVLESATVKSPPSSSSSSSSSSMPLSSPSSFSSFSSLGSKKDPGGIGFIDDIGGEVDGLMSCTESLGFESSDERRVDDEIELCSSSRPTTKLRWRKNRERRQAKKFPPPISSLNHNGQPSFFLRPVRKDGRLELTEIRVDRPEILRASRQNGRLRLHLIRQENNFHHINEEEEEEEEEANLQEQQQEEEVLEEEGEGKMEEVEKAGEWRYPMTGEGFRRCHEVVGSHGGHYHHNLNVWGQHCVTTR